jgi:hypothetical protein
LTFTIENDCNVTITGNATRGNVVLANVTTASTNLDSTCQVTAECLIVGQVVGGVQITQQMYDNWVQIGKPEEWCYDCHYRGDVTGDCAIDSDDILGTADVNGWSDAFSSGDVNDSPGSDTNNDLNIDSSDILGTGNQDGWSEGFTNDCPGTCVPEP